MANNVKLKTELNTLKNFNMGKTKITIEINGVVSTWESDRDDHSIDEVLNGFMGTLIAQTWLPITVLEGMRDFAQDQLECFSNELS